MKKFSPLLLLLPLVGLAQLVPQSVRISLAPDGRLYSDPAQAPSNACVWAGIADIAAENGGSGSLNLSTLVSGCTVSTITLSCSTSLPAGGFSYSGTTLSWSSTTSSTNSCQATVNGSVLSAQFLVASTGNDADVTAPPPPSIDSCVAVSTTQIDCTVLPLADPVSAGYVTSGTSQVRVYVNGSGSAADSENVTGSNFGAAISTTLVGNASSPTANQTGANWSLGITSGDVYGTADNALLLHPSVSIAGDFEVIVYVPAWSCPGCNTFAKVGPFARKTLAADSQGVWAPLFPGNGTNMEHRLTTGASATQQARDASVTAPECLRLKRAGSVWTNYTSPDCNNWVQRQSVTIPMTDPVYAGVLLGQTGGVAASVNIERYSVSQFAPATLSITGLSASTTYSITARAVDAATNLSSASAAVSVTTLAGAPASDPWPRLGLYSIGGSPRNYCTEGGIARIKKVSVAVLGIWDGIGSNCGPIDWGTTVERIGDESLRTNPTQVIAYYNSLQSYNATNQADSEIRNKLIEQNWVLRTTHPSGSIVPGFWNSSWLMANIHYPTMAGLTDGAGRTWFQWIARYHLDVNVTGNSYGTAGGGNAAAPDLAGLYVDDMLFYPGTNASNPGGGFNVDWDRDGSTDSASNASFWPGVRAGIRQVAIEYQALQPQLLAFANLSQCSTSASVSHCADYANFWDGGVLEGMLGQTWSVDGWGSFTEVATAYTRQMNLLKGPRLGILGHSNLSATGTDAGDATAWRAAKYGAALTWVMGDAYYYGTGTSALSSHLWLDYYAVNATGDAVAEGSATGAHLEWLGEAEGEGQALSGTGTYSIRIRFFENGVCAINPKGNGTQSLTTAHLGGSGLYRRIDGTQETSVDNGATVTSSISMPARTGICLQAVP